MRTELSRTPYAIFTVNSVCSFCHIESVESHAIFNSTDGDFRTWLHDSIIMIARNCVKENREAVDVPLVFVKFVKFG